MAQHLSESVFYYRVKLFDLVQTTVKLNWTV